MPAAERPWNDPSKVMIFTPLRLILVVPVFARHLHRQFTRFSAGVREERGISKRMFHQQIRQLLLRRNVVKVRCVPQRVRLFAQRRDQFRVGMAQRNSPGNPGPKVKETSAIRLNQPAAFAFHESQRCARISRQDGGDHRNILLQEANGCLSGKLKSIFSGGCAENARGNTGGGASGAGCVGVGSL